MGLWHCILMCTLRMCFYSFSIYYHVCYPFKPVYLWLYCCCFNSHRTTSLCGLTLASPISVIVASMAQSFPALLKCHLHLFLCQCLSKCNMWQPAHWLVVSAHCTFRNAFHLIKYFSDKSCKYPLSTGVA